LPSCKLSGTVDCQSADAGLELGAVLAHECAHLRHGDLRTLALARLLLILFWPQPLYWWLRRIIRLDQECWPTPRRANSPAA
jgi:Zn-dependent protease with chaperone function